MKKLLAFLLCSTLMLGDSSGPLSGSATGSGWTNPSNVGASDNSYASVSVAGKTGSAVDGDLLYSPSNPLYISSLGFAIPASATVTGITATFERKCSGASSCSTSLPGGYIELSKTAGVGQGTNKATGTWGTSDSTDTIGGGTDLWGSTWSISDINSSGFGLVIVVVNGNTSTRTASVDYMALTVTYSASGSGSHRRVIISQTRTINLSQQGM